MSRANVLVEEVRIIPTLVVVLPQRLKQSAAGALSAHWQGIDACEPEPGSAPQSHDRMVV